MHFNHEMMRDVCNLAVQGSQLSVLSGVSNNEKILFNHVTGEMQTVKVKPGPSNVYVGDLDSLCVLTKRWQRGTAVVLISPERVSVALNDDYREEGGLELVHLPLLFSETGLYQFARRNSQRPAGGDPLHKRT